MLQCNSAFTALQALLTIFFKGGKFGCMTPQDIVQHYGNGNATKAAIALGLTRQAVNVWLRAGLVPLDWQHWVEKDTAGRYKADPRRPNDPHLRALRKNKVTAPAAAT